MCIRVETVVSALSILFLDALVTSGLFLFSGMWPIRTLATTTTETIMMLVTGEQTAAALQSQGLFMFTLAVLLILSILTETCHLYKSFIENDTDYCCKMEKYCAFIVFGPPYALANAVYQSSAVV